MSTIFSRKCEYALQAVLYLALKPRGELTSMKELAKQLELPFHFVSKILQSLTHEGLLSSLKGPSGGFALAVPPEEMTLLRIVEAIDGTGFASSCVLGFSECTDKAPCALHSTWAQVRDGPFTLLLRKSVAELARETKKPRFPQDGRAPSIQTK